jgi:RNase adapter protein RapZ
VSDFVVITGLSGAGRSQGADALEDLGWFVIDNLPPALIPKVSELAAAPGSGIGHVALVMGTGPYQEEVVPALVALRAAASRLRIVFLEASTEVLVRRYESTRRRHPLAADRNLAEAIELERTLYAPMKAEADVVIDTSETNVHQLRHRMQELFADDEAQRTLKVTVSSFGYKHGLPLDVDLVIDCRFLPNPHWVPELRPLTGRDEPVRDYVLGQELSGPFVERLRSLLELLLPAYEAEGKSYITLAFGCTGGRHRSVAIAEDTAAWLREQGVQPQVSHRDVDRPPTATPGGTAPLASGSVSGQ